MRVYNTLTKQKEELKVEKTVRVYVCGITAYDYSHIGHARCAVVFDTLRRYLEWKGHVVRYVQNFTDVDDKIVRRAVSEGKTFREISERYITAYREDMQKLNVREGIHPKVTENIEEIISAISKLIEKGFAYVVDGERWKDVYFHVPSLKSYGKLSGMSLEELNRHRIEPDPRKKDEKDFALWKSAKNEDIQAKAFFNSPWGKGRPGWHIECSVMAAKYLNVPFDVHGGGRDLIFPHHENERAQSIALFGIEPVRYWIHSDFVRIKGEKMSKSLGNIVRVKDVLRMYEGEVLRYFLLSAHYRTALDYSEEAIEKCRRAYEYIKNTVEAIDMEIAALKSGVANASNPNSEMRYITEKLRERFTEAMEDDLNTPLAFAALHNFANRINKILRDGNFDLGNLKFAFNTIKDVCSVLGLFENYRRIPVLGERQVELIKERELCRKERDFERADFIRNKFREMGYQLIDTPRGTRWRLI
ncbi:MAG: cysteine--tRNA ligase [Archaeoglobus sp.]|nr:MAG: cysteine--tRNA ligase [Archaeoglobus sp.]